MQLGIRAPPTEKGAHEAKKQKGEPMKQKHKKNKRNYVEKRGPHEAKKIKQHYVEKKALYSLGLGRRPQKMRAHEAKKTQVCTEKGGPMKQKT